MPHAIFPAAARTVPWTRVPRALLLATASLLALGLFLAVGVVNGFLLYGRPGLLRTAANFLQAIFVAGVLALGRQALQGRGGGQAA